MKSLKILVGLLFLFVQRFMELKSEKNDGKRNDFKKDNLST